MVALDKPTPQELKAIQAAAAPAARGESRIEPHPELPQFYATADEKRQFVIRLFDETAQFYAVVDQVVSLGTGPLYRWRALWRAGLRREMRLLDVATGTGHMVRAAHRVGLAESSIVGVDPSLGMLRQAEPKRARLICSPAEDLPVPQASFDFVSMGFALRHVADLSTTFREFHRVLRPGGRLLVLEISRPRSALGLTVARGYLAGLVPWLVRRRTGSAHAEQLMRYYWETIESCVPPERIVGALDEAGFTQIVRRCYFGIFSEYVAIR